MGYRVREMRRQQAPWGAGSLAILSTDGRSSRWSQARYPGLLTHHPSVIASVLLRDHARDSDDATLVVARRNA
ncbi:MAG: hypothetical protein LH617_08400 [Ramlibacter sp.]|nr:hypothetical protein [Ramlibacter sp.]